MTIKAFEERSQQEALLQMVAEELPIFVLGPGCFRIGFDNPHDSNWRGVEKNVADVLARLDDEEQRFLKDFFFSKFSDERRTEPERKLLERRLEADRRAPRSAAHPDDDEMPEEFESFAPWRSLLAARILQAYREASCCLGLMIGQGLYPVLQWQDAAVPATVIARWVALDTEPDDAQEHFINSGTAIESATHVARAMIAFERGGRPTEDQLSALEEMPFAAQIAFTQRDTLKTVLGMPVSVLLPGAIANKLEVLSMQCFSGDRPEPLRGAHVEWLGDLLWHVLSGDAAVQPAHSDIAFYGALADSTAPPISRELKRPAYGDRPVSEHDVTRLTKHSQPDDSRPAKERERFLETIGRCLLAQSAMVGQREEIADDTVQPYMLDTTVIALVGDYGDLFERSLLGLVAESAVFHLCLPVWVTHRGKRSIDWVVLDVTKGARGASATWRWLADARGVRGPLVIKMSGCDRSPLDLPVLHGRVSQLNFQDQGKRWSRLQNATVEPALLYDEFDRLTATQVFDELLDPEKNDGLAGRLSTAGKGLTWPDRSWLIMGQRFGDWVPRLRMFTQMWAGSKVEAETQTHYWAIDRSFDSPERALLQSLGITMVVGDLHDVGEALDRDKFDGLRRTAIGSRFVRELGRI